MELLLRRCLTSGSQGHKVYSLLFADQLSYEVGCQAEEFFQSLCTRAHREDYQLVILCDAAREHCYIPSTFSQYKVPLVPQAPLPNIQAYLQSHYQVPKRLLSAATVFRDGLCVGIVTSERAGVGNERGPLSQILPTLCCPHGPPKVHLLSTDTRFLSGGMVSPAGTGYNMEVGLAIFLSDTTGCFLKDQAAVHLQWKQYHLPQFPHAPPSPEVTA